MKGIAKVFTAVWLLSGVSSAEATVPSISLETLSSADFGMLSTNPHPAYGFDGAFAVSSFDWNLSTQFGPLGPTIEEREFQQNMRELTARLQAYADQLPDRILIGWIECFGSAEDRLSRTNSISAQWTNYDPMAALEWTLNIDSSENEELRLNSLASRWSTYDPIAASEWLSSMDTEGVSPDRISAMIQRRMGASFNAASSELTSVPEPKAYGLLVGTMALCLIVLKRDFRKRN